MTFGDWIGLGVSVFTVVATIAAGAAVVYAKLCVVISQVSRLELTIAQLFAKDAARDLACAKHHLRTDDLERRIDQAEGER